MEYFWWILPASPLIVAICVAIVEFWDEIKILIKGKINE